MSSSMLSRRRQRLVHLRGPGSRTLTTGSLRQQQTPRDELLQRAPRMKEFVTGARPQTAQNNVDVVSLFRLPFARVRRPRPSLPSG